MRNVVFLFVSVFALVATQLHHRGIQIDNQIVSAVCMGCICEATTGCNLQYNCTGQLCGPLLISEKYWSDSGRWSLDGDNSNWQGAHLRCVTNTRCAAHTVRSYMARFAQDCDGDGQIDCGDFARIHYFGGYHCSNFIERTPYWRTFSRCMCAASLLNGHHG